MSTAYNLRSAKKTKSPSQNCYLQKFLNDKPLGAFNPKVRIKRLNVVESNRHHRFYVKKGQIVPVEFACGKSYSKNGIWKICLVLFLVSSLIYWRDDLQMRGNVFLKETTKFHSALQKYFYDILQLNKNNTKKAELIKEDENIETFIIDLIALEPNQKKFPDKVEVIKMVKDHFSEFKEKGRKTQEPHKNFIEEQCRRECKPKLANNFRTREDELYDLESFGLSNITDYALESQGARIVSVFDTKPYGVLAMKFLEYDFGIINDFFTDKYFKSKGPSLILKVSTADSSSLCSHFNLEKFVFKINVLKPWKNPGDCWAFKGSRGRVEIELSQEIIITSVSVDHITEDRTLYGSLKSAPKKFSIIGLEDDGSQNPSKVHLGTYEYKISGPSTQMFTIEPQVEIFFKIIDLVIESNHGNQEYTCVYKIGVHGLS